MAERSVKLSRLSRTQLSGIDNINVQFNCNLIFSVSVEGYWE